MRDGRLQLHGSCHLSDCMACGQGHEIWILLTKENTNFWMWLLFKFPFPQFSLAPSTHKANPLSPDTLFVHPKSRMEKSTLHRVWVCTQPSPFFHLHVWYCCVAVRGLLSVAAPHRQLCVCTALIHWAAKERVLTVPFSTDYLLIRQAAGLGE